MLWIVSFFIFWGLCRGCVMGDIVVLLLWRMRCLVWIFVMEFINIWSLILNVFLLVSIILRRLGGYGCF